MLTTGLTIFLMVFVFYVFSHPDNNLVPRDAIVIPFFIAVLIGSLYSLICCYMDCRSNNTYLADWSFSMPWTLVMLPITLFLGWPFFLVSYLRMRKAKRALDKQSAETGRGWKMCLNLLIRDMATGLIWVNLMLLWVIRAKHRISVVMRMVLIAALLNVESRSGIEPIHGINTKFIKTKYWKLYDTTTKSGFA